MAGNNYAAIGNEGCLVTEEMSAAGRVSVGRSIDVVEESRRRAQQAALPSLLRGGWQWQARCGASEQSTGPLLIEPAIQSRMD